MPAPASTSSHPVVVARAAVVPMHAEPRVSSPQTSQSLAGQILLVHEEQGDWLRASGVDRYRGWLHRGFVARVTGHDASVELEVAGRAAPWEVDSSPALIHAVNHDATRVSLGCRARVGRGPARALPLGAGLGSEEQLVDGEAVPRTELPRRFPRDAARLSSTAVEHFAGTSYQWGGITPWGADCSGMVQSVFRLHGIELPRDAWQQAMTGVDAGRDPAEALPADLLFFSDRDDGRITHVGISLGAPRMVHLALGRGGYAVDRLDAEGDDYALRLGRRFVLARRFPELHTADG